MKWETPPPPPNFFFYTNFFFLMLEIAWNVKKTWNFYFFQYLKNSYKIQTTFHQYQKLYSTPPWLGARACKVSRKSINAFLSYSAKTKRDGRTDGGRCNISRPGPSAPREIKIVVLVSEPVHGRSRATELPCSIYIGYRFPLSLSTIVFLNKNIFCFLFPELFFLEMLEIA